MTATPAASSRAAPPRGRRHAPIEYCGQCVSTSSRPRECSGTRRSRFRERRSTGAGCACFQVCFSPLGHRRPPPSRCTNSSPAASRARLPCTHATAVAVTEVAASAAPSRHVQPVFINKAGRAAAGGGVPRPPRAVGGPPGAPPDRGAPPPPLVAGDATAALRDQNLKETLILRFC